MVGELVTLYGHEEIEERDETHEVAEFAPDYICIGNDSGDYEFLLKRDGGETVYMEDPGRFNQPTFQIVHPSFTHWIDSGCPLPAEPECPIPLRGLVWLLSTPPEGIKDMFRLKKMLGESWSVPQMQSYLANTPTVLREQRHPYAVHRRLIRYPDLRSVLGFSDSEQSQLLPYDHFAEEV